MGRPTSKDVAREAGVSQSTVSFVLNQTPGQSIPEETQQLVLAAARKLNYVPSAAARALKTGTSRIILCLIPDWPATDAMERLKIGLSNRFAEAGFACVYSHYAAEVPVSTLWQQIQPCAVVGFGSLAPAEVRAIKTTGIAIINGVFSPGAEPSLSPIDQEEIGRMQIRYLHSKGHRRITYVSISDPREAPFVQPRQSGADQECRRLGLAPMVTLSSDGSPEAAEAVIADWQRSAFPSTAMAAFNDNVAIALLAATKKLDIPVPSSLALVGVDDLPVAALVSPALTTVAIDLGVSARILGEKILKRLGMPSVVPTAPGAPTLRIIERDSA